MGCLPVMPTCVIDHFCDQSCEPYSDVFTCQDHTAVSPAWELRGWGGGEEAECLLAGAGALAAEERGHDAQGQLRRAAEVRHRRAHLHITSNNHVAEQPGGRGQQRARPCAP